MYQFWQQYFSMYYTSKNKNKTNLKLCNTDFNKKEFFKVSNTGVFHRTLRYGCWYGYRWDAEVNHEHSNTPPPQSVCLCVWGGEEVCSHHYTLLTPTLAFFYLKSKRPDVYEHFLKGEDGAIKTGIFQISEELQCYSKFQFLSAAVPEYELYILTTMGD